MQNAQRMVRPGSGFLLMVAVTASAAMLPRFALATDAGPCADAAHRQLDYWLGDWAVTAPGSAPNASSKVHLELDGCAVVENWDGGRGHIGENVMAYSADDHGWHGLFLDNKGRVHVFVDGKVEAGSAEFSASSRAEDGTTVLNRVRIVRISADKVEQLWEKSSDHGATWSTEFQGEYSRRKP
jgi:hypothetical protein